MDLPVCTPDYVQKKEHVYLKHHNNGSLQFIFCHLILVRGCERSR